MKELLVFIAVIVAIVAIFIGNIFPQYGIICGWIMISALIAGICIIAFYNEDTK